MAEQWEQWDFDEWRRRLSEPDFEAQQVVIRLSVHACRAELSKRGPKNRPTDDMILDIAYETLDRLSARVCKDPPIQAMKTYTWTITINCLQNHFNKEELFISSIDDTQHPSDPTASRSFAAIEGENAERTALFITLGECYDALKAEERAILDVETMPRAWIIQQLNLQVSANTLNVRILRIKKRLAICLSKKGYSEDRIRTILRRGGER